MTNNQELKQKIKEKQILRNSKIAQDFLDHSNIKLNKKGRKSPTPPAQETTFLQNREEFDSTKKQKSTTSFPSEIVKKERNNERIYVKNNSFTKQTTNVASPQNKKFIFDQKGKSRNLSSGTCGKAIKFSNNDNNNNKITQFGGTAKKIDMKAYNPNLIFQHVGSLLKKKQEHAENVLKKHIYLNIANRKNR